MSELYRHSLGVEGGALRNSVTASTASVISWAPHSANAYHRSLEHCDLWWISVPLFLVVCCLLMRPQIPHERYRQGGVRIREIAQRRRYRAQRQHWQSQLRRLIRNDPTWQKEIVKYSLQLASVERKSSAYMNVVTEGIDINGKAMDPLDIEAGGTECDIHRERSNVSSTADDPNSCMICLDPFREGDVVAWSRVLANPAIANKVAISPDNKGDNVAPSDNLDFSTQPAESANVPTEAPQELHCRHVFHHDCIVSWLLDTTHDDCPCCRTRILFYPPGLIETMAAQSQQGADMNSRRDSQGESDHCTDNGENQLSDGNVRGECERRAETFTSARRFVVANGLVVARSGQRAATSSDQYVDHRSSADIHSGCSCYDPVESSTTSLAPNSDSPDFHRQSFLTNRGSPIFRSTQSGEREFSIFRSNSSDGVRMHTIRSHFRFNRRWLSPKNLLFENSGVDPLIEAPMSYPAAFEPRGFLSRTASCGSGEARDPRLLAWAKTYSKLSSK
jgi:hypothetical protein